MANDFTGDPNCVALWRFEDGALTVDSIGTNTLTNNNGVVANLVDFMEGSASADFEASSNQYFHIPDADLDLDFPLKSGDTNKKISVCTWFQFESLTNHRAIFSKWNLTTERQLVILGVSDGRLHVYIGYNGGSSTEVIVDEVAGTLVTGRKYHLGLTFDDTDKSFQCVLWDDTAQSKTVDVSGNSTNNISVEAAHVGIGASFNSGSRQNPHDGEIDETVVFKDILTAAEIDQIRAKTYGAGSVVSLEDVRLNLSAYYQDLSDLAAWLKAHDGLEFADFPALLAAFLQDTEDLPAHLSAYHQDLADLMLDLQTWAWSIDDVKTALETQGVSLSDLNGLFEAGGWELCDIETVLAATDAIVRKDLAALLWATDGIVTNDFSVYLSALGLVPAFRSITAQRLTSVITEIV